MKHLEINLTKKKKNGQELNSEYRKPLQKEIEWRILSCS